MNILNLFKVSINAVANNKMRSFLSMLGIIIGVAAVLIMMAILAIELIIKEALDRREKEED